MAYRIYMYVSPRHLRVHVTDGLCSNDSKFVKLRYILRTLLRYLNVPVFYIFVHNYYIFVWFDQSENQILLGSMRAFIIITLC